jgi:hypothetical protein
MIEIWCEQQNIPYSISKESENEYVFKKYGIHTSKTYLLMNLLNLVKICMKNSQKLQ